MRQRTTVVSPPSVATLRCLSAVSFGILLAVLPGGCRKGVEPAPVGQAGSAAAAKTDPSVPVTSQPAAETWDAVFIGGTQVGSIHTTTTPGGDPVHPEVRIVSDTQLAIPRFGDVARMRVVTESVETTAGVVRQLLASHRIGCVSD